MSWSVPNSCCMNTSNYCPYQLYWLIRPKKYSFTSLILTNMTKSAKYHNNVPLSYNNIPMPFLTCYPLTSIAQYKSQVRTISKCVLIPWCKLKTKKRYIRISKYNCVYFTPSNTCKLIFQPRANYIRNHSTILTSLYSVLLLKSTANHHFTTWKANSTWPLRAFANYHL